METVTVNYDVFSFDELSPEVQEKVLDKNRDTNVNYDEWWDGVEEDAKECGKILGIDIGKIYFSGFSSQGDGACFEGSYDHGNNLGNVAEKIKEHAPDDEVLHRIGRELQKIQEENDFALAAKVKHSGHYCHSRCTDVQVWDMRDNNGDVTREIEEAVTELLRDFMDWIYRQLEGEYEYLTSDERVKESIEDLRFLANGKVFNG